MLVSANVTDERGSLHTSRCAAALRFDYLQVLAIFVELSPSVCFMSMALAICKISCTTFSPSFFMPFQGEAIWRCNLRSILQLHGRESGLGRL